MATKWVYCPDPKPEDSVLSVEGEEHRHLKVSRTRVGESVEVFDGAGSLWEGAVVAVDRQATRIRLGNVRRYPRPSVEIILGQALIKRAPFEWLLEKTVEIGVTRVIPFRAARSNPSRDLPAARWRRIIVEAAKQSKRHHLPRLERVVRFDDLLGFPAVSKILFCEQGGVTLKTALIGGPVLYCIGPEGGWTQEELESARAGGMVPVQLGTGILRAETAAVAAAALIAYEMGVFES